MPKSKKYLIACSGGPDSMALLDQYHKDIVCICHVNYHSSKSANRDQHIVESYAKKHKIKCLVYNVDPKIYKKKFNFESWAREVRYNFFNDCARKLKVYNVLMAHHLDDWLETAIMQMKRGSQTMYYGIKQHSQYKDIKIYRPFINVRKKELVKYCKAHKIKYGVDETNKDPKFARNKVRLALATLSEKEIKLFISDFKEVNREFEIIEKYAAKAYKDWTKQSFYIPFLLKQHPKVQDELIYQLINTYSPKRNSSNKINGLLNFIKSAKGNISYRLNNNVCVYKKNKYLKIIKS